MPEDDRSGRLGLPYLLPAQAQKHVTHNEALQRLDALVQLVVAGFSATTPPPEPAEGEVHALGTAPTGAWEGQAGMLAGRAGGDWFFVAPGPGWLAHDLNTGGWRVFRDGDWHPAAPEVVARLGVNTDADAMNRLAVAAPASLFTHDGAGHQLKLNKATAADTASLLYQTDWSGRVELGLTGSDDFAIKVSADGSDWTTAFGVAVVDGRVSLPAGLLIGAGNAGAPGLAFAGDGVTGIFGPDSDQIGLTAGGVEQVRITMAEMQVNGPITGAAVTQTMLDTTAGRLVKTGDYGWGAVGAAVPDDDIDNIAVAGIYRIMSATAAGSPNLPGMSSGSILLHLQFNSDNAFQMVTNRSSEQSYLRVKALGTWKPFRPLYHGANILGTVSRAGGTPTGALIESGSNANGDYVRWADGTQICRIEQNAAGSAATNWAFPAAFVAAPVVTGTAVAAVLAAICLDAAPTSTMATFSIRDHNNARRADPCHLLAVGRWF